MKNLGPHMKHALEFARKYIGWHSFNKRCNSTTNAIKRLEKCKLVEVNNFFQFRAISN